MKKNIYSLLAVVCMISCLVSCGSNDTPQPDNNTPNNPVNPTPPTPRTYATVSTWVGSTNNATGSTDATGTNARFNQIIGGAFDSQGNFFVPDYSNHTIRKITPAGVVTTFAGTAGSSGRTNGTGAAARFNQPGGICIDAADNLYVTDYNNHTIRKITSQGVVTDFAGGGGNSLAGSANGTGTAARFAFPVAIAIDAQGNLYVSEASTAAIEKPRIRKVTPAGEVTVLAGGAQVAGGGSAINVDGTGEAAGIKSPRGLCVDAEGNVYVANDFTVRKITSAGVVTTLAGIFSQGSWVDGVGASARFRSANGVCLDRFGNLFVADEFKIRKIVLSSATVSTLAGTNTQGDTDGALATSLFRSMYRISIDKNDVLYTTHQGNIRKIE
jgi:sugar lactone lactonase YvrE